MININVDMEKCQHYGQCVYEAPDIFSLNADDKLEFVATADDSRRHDVQSAVDVCPMQAISIVD